MQGKAAYPCSQSELRHAFAWKTGNEMHFVVLRNSALCMCHNDVIYYT